MSFGLINMNNDQQTAVIEKDLKDLEKKVDNHISIYIRNGQEIAKNNQLLQDHIKRNEEQWNEIKPAIQSYKQQEKDWEYIRPMVRDYKTFINGGKVLKTIVYFTLIVGSAVTVWYKLLK